MNNIKKIIIIVCIACGWHLFLIAKLDFTFEDPVTPIFEEPVNLILPVEEEKEPSIDLPVEEDEEDEKFPNIILPQLPPNNERESKDKEEQERRRLEKERQEKERLEKERLEKEKAEREKNEKARLERERAEQEKARVEKERAEQEKLAKERLEKEQAEQEKAKAEADQKARAEQEKAEQEKDRLTKEKSDTEIEEKKSLQEKPKEPLPQPPITPQTPQTSSPSPAPTAAPLPPSKPVKKKKVQEDDKTSIIFDFKDKNLGEIVNLYAAKKKANIVLPQGAQAIKTTVTFEQKDKVPLNQAEKYVDLFLDLSGYIVHPSDGFNVITQKIENSEGREPLHLYVNVPPDDLPHSSEAIRAIYYLSNMHVPSSVQENVPINDIINSIFGSTKNVTYDVNSNGIIIYGNANKIASAMNIILALDSTGSPEVVEMFPLFHTNAEIVAKLMKDLIATNKKPTTPQGKLANKNETGFYFTPNTNILADNRTNNLIMMGTEPALKRIKSFIREYIDVPIESGESLLMVYDIQYLDAKVLAETLTKLVKRSETGQSEADKLSGPHRFFEDVIISAQVKEEIKSEVVKDKSSAVSIGGNRIIVAAKRDDQKIIKDLIDKLDKPEMQVIIEVMILDITLDTTKVINAQTRNPLSLQLPDNITFQNANITSILTGKEASPAPGTTPTLVTDLLELIVGSTPPVSMAVNPGSSGSNIGATIISIKDSCQNGIWAVLQILENWTSTTVVSHPFLVTKNHVPALNKLTFFRRGAGRDVASGGVVDVKVEDFPAYIDIKVTPHASSLERLNLEIAVDVQNFTSTNPSVFTRFTRNVTTNATLNSGQILVLGGLTREVDIEVETKWPILGDVPILGQLFRGVSRTKTKINLAVILHPTVVHPKMRSGQNRYTDSHIKTERSLLTNDELFSNSKDPIMRWFFGNISDKRGDTLMNNYLNDVHYQETHNEATFNPIDWEVNKKTDIRHAVSGKEVMQ